jgi:hypothetical protein
MTSSYSVQFVGHVIQDEFTEYHMKVTSSDNTSWLVRRRYREFRELHDHLKLKYPDRIPSMPGKKLWGNQDPGFVVLEPDCRTRVLQRFLEIKKLSGGGSPVIENMSSPQRSSSSVPTSVSLAKPAPSVAASQAELHAIVSEFEGNIFDLSIQPTLLDAGEYEVRRKRYADLVASATVAAVPSVVTGPKPNASVWERAAWDPARGDNIEAQEALSAIIGKAPIANEKDLVAFFTTS